jgi:hypothetical protein
MNKHTHPIMSESGIHLLLSKNLTRYRENQSSLKENKL